MIEFVGLRTLLDGAKKDRYAVPHFNVFNLEMMQGVLDAAQNMLSPVIVAYGEGFRDLLKQDNFPDVVRSLRRNYSIPVCIHLDHAFRFEALQNVAGAGYTSAMLDVSYLPYEENVRLTRAAVELCHPLGVDVEAEIGHVGGLSDIENDDQVYTETAAAVDFVRRTGIDALAVSIGTVHGVYRETPCLNLDRLREIARSVREPLVLHGGSGLSEDQFRDCIQNGIAKVNIHTDLALAAMHGARGGEGGYLDACIRAREAVCREAMEKIDLFGSANRA